MEFPERIKSPRLLLRAPHLDDAGAIFDRYAGNPEVTRFLGWPTHRSLDDTRAYLEVAAQHREEGSELVYVLERDGAIVGGISLLFEAPHRATMSYVLAKPAWRQGLASEATQAVRDLAFQRPAFTRLQAMCHASHARAERVLHKTGFAREGFLRCHSVFPNLNDAAPQDVGLWAIVRSYR